MTRSSEAAKLDEAFNSMLRTDYIALSDTAKLSLLADYYIDYFNYVSEMVQPIDHFIVGRRGTGKTTLLYRAFVECMRSWQGDGSSSQAKPRTLGVYLDLVKCQSLSSTNTADYEHFEHAFVSELCDALKEELVRSWPELEKAPGIFERIFQKQDARRAETVRRELEQLAEVLRSGVPRLIDKSGAVELTEKKTKLKTSKSSVSGKVGKAPEVTGQLGSDETVGSETSQKRSERVDHRLTVADFLRVVGGLREAADIPCVIIFVDEFSSLDETLQRRFTTLLKKILGNHDGVYVKLCAITDHFQLGSSIILQRDLFELSLDLDSFVERSGSMAAAMEHLVALTKKIVGQRLEAYKAPKVERLFRDPESIFRELTYSSMGVPRTLGIVLKQSWSRANVVRDSSIQIGVKDIDYGIRYASRAYLNQMLGAARGGVAIPEHVIALWESLLTRASEESKRSRGEHSRRSRLRDDSASHFMVVPKYEPRLKYLNMFFLVHLLEQGGTSKKQGGLTRSLYCFDFGTARENFLGWSNDRDVFRQQRFAYDDVLLGFDKYYQRSEDEEFSCPTCGSVYRASELVVAGTRLTFCPKDRQELKSLDHANPTHTFTEEEIKIIGAIRSASKNDLLIARQIADDVGCYIQKVAKFGEKIDKEGLISREKPSGTDRNIYFAADNSEESES